MFKRIYKEVMSNLESNLPSWLHYHSPDHTRYVLSKAEFLAEQEGVQGRDLCLIQIAALYHDLGFIKGRKEHERKSCEMAATELPKYEISPEEIQKICGMIMATKIPQEPKNLLEKILADADLEYLGTDGFFETSEKLYRELLHNQPGLSRKKWNEIQVYFLSNHSYHTTYCRIHCEGKKAEHLAELQRKLSISS